MSNTNGSSKSLNVLIEQYKLYVEMMDRISSRRSTIGNYYLSLVVGIIGILSMIIEKKYFANNNMVIYIIGILGLIICIIWFINILSYKQINSLKFKVIEEMENDLPYQCYTREWEILKSGSNKFRYTRLSFIERIVPLFLSLLFLFLIIYSVLKF